MQTLLYCDLLGIKELWRQRGLRKVKGRFNLFESLVDDALFDLGLKPDSSLVSGYLDSDSAALSFNSPDLAILAGIRIWRRVFEQDSNPGEDQRLYVRGVIVNQQSLLPLREPRASHDRLGIKRWGYSPDLLEAIFLEKSGFRGMRLLIEDEILTPPTISAAKQQFKERFFVGFQGSIPLTARLLSSQYPEGRKDISDVLWPLDTTHNLGQLEERMNRRLESARGQGDELRHAKNTAVVIREVRRRLGKN